MREGTPVFVVSNQEMRQIDRYTADVLGIPAIVLMENAGRVVADEVVKRGPFANICVVAGKGNNGGDGLVAARHLKQKGFNVSVVVCADKDRLAGEAKTNYQAAVHWGIPIFHWTDPGNSEAAEQIRSSDCVVDALLGTGTTRSLDGVYRLAVDAVNKSSAYVISVDIPSGLQADTGETLGGCVQADVTVTLAFPKRGMYLYPGASCTGEVVVGDISIPEVAALRAGVAVRLVTGKWVASRMPLRPADSHKGTFGHVAVVGGDRSMTGAALLSAAAAYRTGCGLVSLYVAEDDLPLYTHRYPETLLHIVRAQQRYNAKSLLDFLDGKQAVVIGPGLKRFDGDAAWLEQIVREYGGTLVLDAGALDILASDWNRWKPRSSSLIVTPHPGEMARLLQKHTGEIQADRLGAARELATLLEAPVILKGAYSICAWPGGEIWVNTTGNSGMATGGTGDVLAGMVASLCAQGLEPGVAASAGMFLHGLAGDLACGARNSRALLASDMIEAIGEAYNVLLRMTR
jgi:hydroxyethylthiazole kinase-like uncharacterized protein yjeF